VVRQPKPWYRADRAAWFVTIRGVRHNLGPNKKLAHDAFYDLMRQPEPKPVLGKSFPAIADSFLEWVQKNRAPDTYEWYRYRIERFCQRYPNLTLLSLKPFHVQQWVDSYPALTKTSQRNYIRSIKRCIAWARQQGYIDQNPLEFLEAPGAESKDVFVPPDEFEILLGFMKDDSMRQLCEVAYAIGCRPQEILRVEARHLDAKNQRWVFPIKEAKGKKKPRIVYLTDKAFQICSELASKYPDGKLFRNSRGKPWTTEAVNCAFCRLQHQLGRQQLQKQSVSMDTLFAQEQAHDESVANKTYKAMTRHERRRIRNRVYTRFAPKYSLYAFRHSWATNALRRGVDPLTVATLMGHSDPSVLSRTYSHIAHSPDHMLAQAKRAAGT
jgi:integrase